MNKKDKVALVPRLRFPEFRSTGEWKIITLSKLASKITVRNQENLINRVLTNSAAEGVVDQSDYFNREVANPNNLENYFVIDEGDYVYNPRISVTAPVGPVSKNKVGRGVMSPLYTVFKFENPNNDFYEQYFKTNLWHAYLKSVSNTGARHDRMSISNGNFMRMPLPYPSEGEQQKIAECLSTLDGLINAEDKKLEALKAYKKGLMQKLFPAEGETVPEWRFPEFRDNGEWERNTIGRSCVSFSGGTPDTSNKAYYNGSIPFIRSGEINKNSTELFITEEGFDNSAAKMVRKGDILVALYGANSGEVSLSKIEGAINQAILCLQHEINNAFVYQYLFHKKNWITTTYIQGGQGNLSGEIVKSIELYFPKPEEQQKIADCLSALDVRITAQAEKIEALQAHKKGLMQGLFPSIEEVGK